MPACPRSVHQRARVRSGQDDGHRWARASSSAARPTGARVQDRPGFSGPDDSGARKRRASTVTRLMDGRRGRVPRAARASGDASRSDSDRGRDGSLRRHAEQCRISRAAFGVPIVAVISAKAMAQTFGAVAFGLARFRPDVPFHGVFANRVGSARHAQMLEEALPDDLKWMGCIASTDEIELPDRHLGLLQAGEIADLDRRLDLAADALAQTPLAQLPRAVQFVAPLAMSQTKPLPRLLSGAHVAIARDAAFSFIYPANIALLEALGARISFFFTACRRAGAR